MGMLRLLCLSSLLAFTNCAKKDGPSQLLQARQLSDSLTPQFYLYEPNNLFDASFNHAIQYNSLSDSLSRIPRSSAELFVVVHGYGAKHPEKWENDMVAALTQKGFRVLRVLWNLASAEPKYVEAVKNCETVGQYTAKVLEALTVQGKIDIAQATCIGHGLGAHVCGFTGKRLNLFNAAARRVPLYRIFGLDPQSHLFNSEAADKRLDASDAELVWVLHTDSRKKKLGMAYGEGMSHSIGRADFFANGGTDQPGCPPSKRTTAELESKTYEPSCDHMVSTRIMIEAIKNFRDSASCRFDSFRCSTEEELFTGNCQCPRGFATLSECPVFGLELDRISAARGNYSFFTRKESNANLCGYQYQVFLDTATSGKVKGEVSIGIEFSGIYKSYIGTAGPFTEIRRSYVAPWGVTPSKIEVSYKKSLLGPKELKLANLGLRSMADNRAFNFITTFKRMSVKTGDEESYLLKENY